MIYLDNLTKIINARGTYTPLGVSRTSPEVCMDVVEALSNYFIIDELQDLASQSLKRFTGAEAAAITHCTAASITVSVAAAMTGNSLERIAALPDTTGMKDCVIIPAGHCVNYGHSILQAIRLSGARPIIAGLDRECSLADIEQKIEENNACCLLLVSSKLVKSQPIDFAEAVKIAGKHGIPTIIDAAAQDFRIRELLQTGADLVLISAQKYLASPTAGLVIGHHELVDAVRAQEKGIGRGMKATKEAIIGVLSAVDERCRLDLGEWQKLQEEKVSNFVRRSGAINGVTASCEADLTGLPFSRAVLQVDENNARCGAAVLVDDLKSGTPSIRVIEDKVSQGQLGFELVQVSDIEIETILAGLTELLS